MKSDMKKRENYETYQGRMERLLKALIEQTLTMLRTEEKDYSEFMKPICSVYNDCDENYTHLAFYPVWDEALNRLICIRPAIQDKHGVVALLMNMHPSQLSLDDDFIRCLAVALRAHRNKYDDDFLETDDFVEWHPNGVWYVKGLSLPKPEE